MATDIPFRKQLQFAPQQGIVVGRQYIRPRGELPFDQRIDGVAKEVVRIVGIECAQIGGRTQVGQQQEAALDILCENTGGIDARFQHQRGDMHERAAILLWRRRIHQDQRCSPRGKHMRCAKRDAEITAKACVRRRGRQRECLRMQGLRQPLGEEREARVGVGKIHRSRLI